MITTIGTAEQERGGVVIRTNRPPESNLSDTVTVIWQDRRTITPEQRRKAWALIGEIAVASGYSSSERGDVNRLLKAEFLRAQFDRLQADAIRAFSMSDIDLTTARMYIDYLVAFCVENNVPTRVPLVEYAEDVGRYVYACCTVKQCAVCGARPADLHHWERIGMGADRREVNHIGLRCEPLCRTHHNECHTMAQEDFDRKYHIEPVKIDERIAKVFKLNRRNT